MISIEELAKYSDQFIALSEDKNKIFTSAKTIKQLERKLGEMKIAGIIIHYLHPIDKALTLLCRN